MQVRLIIPGHDTSTPGNRYLRYLHEIADIAGGFTSWHGIGGWRSDKGYLVIEPVTIVDCNLVNSYWQLPEEGVDRFRVLAQQIAHDFRQEYVYLRIDGKVEYIKP